MSLCVQWSFIQKDKKKLKEWEIVAFLLKSENMIRPYTASNAFTLFNGRLPDYKNKTSLTL